MSVGGSVESITLSGRVFSVTADADTQRKLGGFENEIQSNGDGTARIVKTRVPLALTGLVVNCDDLKGDHEFLQDLSSQNDFFPFVVTYASGESYQGLAQIEGELQNSSQNATATFGLMGPGGMTKQ